MTFTAMNLGTWLTLFGGIGGVVTLLYLLRMRRRRVEVPFGPLWQKVLTERQTSSLWRVLKRFWSLLLQLAFLALILTALADPRWTGDFSVDYQPPREPEPHHTLLVVDTSASMQATDVEGGRMAQAITAAREVIDTLRPSETAMVARMDRDVVALTDWTQDRDALRQAVDGLAAADTGTDAAPLMQFARNAVRGLENAQVVVVTDRAFTPPDKELAKAIHLEVIPVGGGQKAANLAVMDFSVRSHLGNGLKYALWAKVKNVADKPVRARVYLYADPDGKARTRKDFVGRTPAMPPLAIDLAPGEEQLVEREAVDLDGSRAALVVEADTPGYVDALPADDVGFAVVPQRKAVKVLLVGPEDLFLDAALQTRAGVEVSRVAPAQYSSSKGYDLTVFDGPAPKAVDAGSAVYVHSTGEDLPFAAQGTTAGGPVAVVGERQNHPLMRWVKFVDLEVDAVQKLKPRKGDVVMARVKGGKPAVLAHTDADRRWIAVGFDPIASEWVGHYSFSIFFVNAINWFFSEESRLVRPWGLAERWDVPLPWKGLDQVELTAPDGTKTTALVDPGGTLVYSGRHEGIYEVRHPAPKSDEQRQPVVIAAALRSPAESQLDARGEYASWVPPEVEAEDAPPFALLGADVWQLFVLGALGLMLLEWFTYHRRWTV